MFESCPGDQSTVSSFSLCSQPLARDNKVYQVEWSNFNCADPVHGITDHLPLGSQGFVYVLILAMHPAQWF